MARSQAADTKIRFARTVAEAREQSDERPIVIYFGAEWCGWCRKMETETFANKSVEPVGEKFGWVKIDVDSEPAMASQYQVRGLPRTIVLNTNGHVIGSRSGYLSSTQLVEFLETTLAHPLPDPYQLDSLANQLESSEDLEEHRQTTRKLVEALSGNDRLVRPRIVAILKDAPVTTDGILLELMSEKQLRIRAAAAVALRQRWSTNLEFDPFAAPDIREQQLEGWKSLLNARTKQPS